MKITVQGNKIIAGDTVIEFSNHKEALNAIAVWLEIWEGEQKQLPKVATNSHSIEKPISVISIGRPVPSVDIGEIAKHLFREAKKAGGSNNGK